MEKSKKTAAGSISKPGRKKKYPNIVGSGQDKASLGKKRVVIVSINCRPKFAVELRAAAERAGVSRASFIRAACIRLMKKSSPPPVSTAGKPSVVKKKAS